MNELGRVKISEQLHLSTEELIENGVRNLGVYHVLKPLVFDKQKRLVSQDFRLLYFYHNRLTNYGLERAIEWKKAKGTEMMELPMQA